MKYLNLTFIAVCVLIMVSCGGEAKKTTHIEEAESMEVDDNEMEDVQEEDESDFLEAAMNALDAGDNTKAVDRIMKAVDHIKSYVGEMDDPVHANNAIEALLDIVTKIKTGTKLTSDNLEEALLKLDFFSDDDLDIDDDEIDESSTESEE